MVRQYRIHTDLDGFENKIYDMTNGLIRLYQPSDLGIINSTNIWQSQGIGVMGNNNISHPDIDFKFETFGNSLEENYRIFNEFINSIIKQKYITLEYTNEIGTYFADIQLSKITKTEGYGFDGQFSETISFIPVNMWYVYEQLKFSKVQNGEIGGNTKIYTTSKYTYDYTYFGEDNIERLSKWKIDDGIFSFTARVVPSEKMSTSPTTSGKNYYGVRFLDEDFNEYTAITFESNTKPESIQFNTDVNDEYYLAQIGTTAVNVFSALNYQRFRTRFIQKGTMELVNVDVVEINVKRKVEFV